VVFRASSSGEEGEEEAFFCDNLAAVAAAATASAVCEAFCLRRAARAASKAFFLFLFVGSSKGGLRSLFCFVRDNYFDFVREMSRTCHAHKINVTDKQWKFSKVRDKQKLTSCGKVFDICLLLKRQNTVTIKGTYRSDVWDFLFCFVCLCPQRLAPARRVHRFHQLILFEKAIPAKSVDHDLEWDTARMVRV